MILEFETNLNFEWSTAKTKVRRPNGFQFDARPFNYDIVSTNQRPSMNLEI